MGKTGTITHGYSNWGNTIDIMDWYSNESGLTHDDFLDFVELLNEYFQSDAELKSYDNVSDETYVWIDHDARCYVLASFDDSIITVSWRYEPELVSPSSSEESTPTTTATPATPKVSPTSTHNCEECGKPATKSIVGFNDTTEWYCDDHYQQILDAMEKIGVGSTTGQVGSGSSSSSSSTTTNSTGNLSDKEFDAYYYAQKYIQSNYYSDVKFNVFDITVSLNGDNATVSGKFTHQGEVHRFNISMTMYSDHANISTCTVN